MIDKSTKIGVIGGLALALGVGYVYNLGKYGNPFHKEEPEIKYVSFTERIVQTDNKWDNLLKSETTQPSTLPTTAPATQPEIPGDYRDLIREINGNHNPVRDVVANAAANYNTNDLNGDSDEVLLARVLYGEARNCTREERIAIGYTAVNRANDGKKWNGTTVREALLKKFQYSCLNENDPNRAELMNPRNVSKFEECLEDSREVLNDTNAEYNLGQTHYFAKSMKIPPKWSKSKQMKQLGDIVDPSKHTFSREN